MNFVIILIRPKNMETETRFFFEVTFAKNRLTQKIF